MATNMNNDDEINMSDEDDSRHWLPINASQQDGQGMFFPDVTLSPSSSLPSTSANPTPTLPSSFNTWDSVFAEHAALLSNKSTMDRRKFNKSVMLLLNKAIALAKSTTVVSPQPMMGVSNNNRAIMWQDPKVVFGEFRDILLSKNEKKSEELVERLVTFVNQSLSPLLTADEHKEELQRKSVALLQDLSPQMSIKLTPVIKSYIARQFGSNLEDMLAEVSLPEMSLQDKTNLYTRMINRFLDDVGCTSFAFSSRRLLGNISPVDLWFLTFFSFVTVKRCRGDNLLMLGCVGELIHKHLVDIIQHVFTNCFYFIFREKLGRQELAL